MRRDLLEQLKPFSHDRRIEGAEPGDVAAGPGEALYKPEPDRVDYKHKDDRYRVSPFAQLGQLYQDLAGRAFEATSKAVSGQFGVTLPAWTMPALILYVSMASATLEPGGPR